MVKQASLGLSGFTWNIFWKGGLLLHERSSNLYADLNWILSPFYSHSHTLAGGYISPSSFPPPGPSDTILSPPKSHTQRKSSAGSDWANIKPFRFPGNNSRNSRFSSWCMFSPKQAVGLDQFSHASLAVLVLNCITNGSDSEGNICIAQTRF